MASPSDKLAESLSALKALQTQGGVALRASQFSRTHRERLLRAGFIQQVMKGWYIPARPDEPSGESTAWYASFWSFCADYLDDRFGQDWCLSAEQSLSLHVGNWTVPRQLLVRATRGGNKPTQLLYGTSIFDIRLDLPADKDTEIKSGLRILNLPSALISCAPGQFAAHAIDTRVALGMVTDASDVLRSLLDGGHSSVAGRLAGAFRNIGREKIADRIVQAMRAAGFVINETNPFLDHAAFPSGTRDTSPQVNRMRMMWAKMREPVLHVFPAAPGLPSGREAYLKNVDDLYGSDAYNSLSIEGYRVNAELIERVRSGNWNPDGNENDQQNRDALAARGYWQAFLAVKRTLEAVLRGTKPGEGAEKDYDAWYAELFGPSVAAGIIKPSDLAGFRNGPVYIRRSMHVPPDSDAVRELMSALFDLLKAEEQAAVRAVLGHFIFVWIHPYFDGNGRMGRFLMNVMLASGGYPWTVVPLDRRPEYMASLETASVEQRIAPFATFIASLIKS
jgi:Fic/DOC family protein